MNTRLRFQYQSDKYCIMFQNRSTHTYQIVKHKINLVGKARKQIVFTRTSLEEIYHGKSCVLELLKLKATFNSLMTDRVSKASTRTENWFVAQKMMNTIGSRNTPKNH